mmetsp:Transcript_2385/g.5160  ORF Transcript_2385/g.5160 Transcript_2385/m.5160 type:complete len:242 (-) Transcript_2385:1505-2230(-)
MNSRLLLVHERVSSASKHGNATENNRADGSSSHSRLLLTLTGNDLAAFVAGVPSSGMGLVIQITDFAIELLDSNTCLLQVLCILGRHLISVPRIFVLVGVFIDRLLICLVLIDIASGILNGPIVQNLFTIIVDFISLFFLGVLIFCFVGVSIFFIEAGHNFRECIFDINFGECRIVEAVVAIRFLPIIRVISAAESHLVSVHGTFIVHENGKFYSISVWAAHCADIEVHPIQLNTALLTLS